MTNGHWDTRREKEKQADVLYAQGKIQEADYLLGKQLHPGYIPVNERDALGLVTDIDGNVKKKLWM